MMGWEQNSFIIKYGLGHILYKLAETKRKWSVGGNLYCRDLV